MRLLLVLFFLPLIESFNREAGLLLLVILSLIFGIKLSRKSLQLDTISFLFLSMIGIFAVTLPFSISIVSSAKELARFISYFIIFQHVREEVAVKNFSIQSLFLVILFDTLLLTFLWGVYSLPFFHFDAPSNTMNLFYPTFGHNRIALMYLFSLPITLVLSFSSKTHIRRLLFFLLTLVTLCLILFTNARGVLVSLGVSVFITVLLLQRSQFQLPTASYAKNLSRWGLFLLLLAILFLSSSFIFSNFVIPKSQSATGYQYWKGFYKPIANEYRVEYLRQAWEGFRRSPIIGTGLGTFRSVSLMFQSHPDLWSWYAHNHFAELFTETGIAGGGAFLLLMLAIGQRLILLIRSKEISSWDLALVIPLIGLLLHSFIDYDFHYLSIFLFFWIYAALLLPYKETGKSTLSSISRKPIISTLTLGIVILSFIIFQNSLFDRVISELDKDQQYVYALPLLRLQFMLDRANGETAEKIGDTLVSLNRGNEASLWYARSVLRQPYYSQRAIMKDAQIYVEQMEKLADTYNLAAYQKKMDEFQRMYPPVWRHIHAEDGTPESFQDKKKYSLQLLNNLTQVDLSKEEIKEIENTVKVFIPSANLFE